MSDEQKAAAETKTVASTLTCYRCKRHMWASYLETVDGKSVCNAKNIVACNRLAAERKPRAKVSQ